MRKITFLLTLLALFFAKEMKADTWSSGFTTGTTGYLSDIRCFEVNTPNVNFFQFSSFALEHDAANNNGNFGGDTHLMFSSFRITETSNVPASYFEGISENCPTSRELFTYTFAKPVVLIGNTTYYVFFGKDNGDGTYNLVIQGVKVRTGLSNTGFVCYDKNNAQVSTGSSYAWLPNWSVNYSTPSKYVWTGIQPKEGEGTEQQDKLTSGGKIGVGAMSLYNTPAVTGTNYTLNLRQMKIFFRPSNDQPTSNTFGYMLISSGKAASTTNVPASAFVAVSNNCPNTTTVPNSSTNASGCLFTYFFDAGTVLNGNTQYYAYVGTKNQDGTFNLIKYGLRINHQMTTDNGWSYATSVDGSINNVGKTDTKYWETCYYMFFDDNENYPVSYTCKNMAGYTLQNETSTSTTPYFNPPTITGYTLDKVMDGESEFNYETTPITSADKSLDVYYHLTENPITPSTVEKPVYFCLGQYGSITDKVFYYNSSDKRVMTNSSITNPLTAAITDTKLWYFVGDETNGYVIYNKDAGTSEWIGASSPVRDTKIKMTSDKVDEKPVKWDIIYYDGQYMLRHIGTSLFFNRSSNGGVYWDVKTGNGDNIKIQNTITLYDERLWNVYGKTAGCVNGYNISDVKPTTLDGYVTMAGIINAGTKVAFNNNSYYYIQNIGISGVLNAIYDGGNIVGRISPTDLVADNNKLYKSLTPYWKLTLVSAENNTYYIKNADNGLYITSIPENSNSSNPRVTLTSTPTEITLTDKELGQFFITAGANTYGINENANLGVTTWTDEANSRFKLVPVGALIEEITMLNPTKVYEEAESQTGVTDVYMSYASRNISRQFPSTVTLYKVVAGGSRAEVNMEEVTSGQLPANSGIIIKAKNGIQIPTLNLTPAPTVVTETLDGNCLVNGNNTTADGYILAYKKTETTPRFYLMDGYTVAYNKAYLPADYVGSSVRELSLSFGDIETGVNPMEISNETNSIIYDLQGRRVQKVEKGIYIIGGKKVLVK